MFSFYQVCKVGRYLCHLWVIRFQLKYFSYAFSLWISKSLLKAFKYLLPVLELPRELLKCADSWVSITQILINWPEVWTEDGWRLSFKNCPKTLMFNKGWEWPCKNECSLKLSSLGYFINSVLSGPDFSMITDWQTDLMSETHVLKRPLKWIMCNTFLSWNNPVTDRQFE